MSRAGTTRDGTQRHTTFDALLDSKQSVRVVHGYGARARHRGVVAGGLGLQTDSAEYEILARACQRAANLDPTAMSCEIGLREGGGTKHMLDALAASGQTQRVHVAIDPYGNIDYRTTESVTCRLNYTNAMRNRCLRDLYAYLAEMQDVMDVLVFVLEDVEFFARYADGVPVYRQHKQLLTRYAVVHFDGPHAEEPLRREAEFFIPRIVPGGYFVFDDIQDHYDHGAFERWLLSRGFRASEIGNTKASYQRD